MKRLLIYVLFCCFVLQGCGNPSAELPQFSILMQAPEETSGDSGTLPYSSLSEALAEVLDIMLSSRSREDEKLLRKIFDNAISDYISDNGMTLGRLPSPDHFLFLFLYVVDVDMRSRELDLHTISAEYATDIPASIQASCPFAINVYLGQDFDKTPIMLYCSENRMYVGRGNRCYLFWDVTEVVQNTDVTSMGSREESDNSLQIVLAEIGEVPPGLRPFSGALHMFFRYYKYPQYTSARFCDPHKGMPAIREHDTVLCLKDALGNEYCVIANEWCFYLSFNSQTVFYTTNSILSYPYDKHVSSLEIQD